MNMGIVEESLGNYQKALEYHEKSLEIKIKFLEMHHVNVEEAASQYSLSLGALDLASANILNVPLGKAAVVWFGFPICCIQL